MILFNPVLHHPSNSSRYVLHLIYHMHFHALHFWRVILIPIRWVHAIALSIWSCVWLQWSLSGSFTWIPANAPTSLVSIPFQHHLHFIDLIQQLLFLCLNQLLCCHTNVILISPPLPLLTNNSSDLSMISWMSLPWNWHPKIVRSVCAVPLKHSMYFRIHWYFSNPTVFSKHLQLCRDFCNECIQHCNLLWKYFPCCF